MLCVLSMFDPQMSQMPVPGTEDLNVLIPCIPEGPNADVSGPSGFDGSVSSNIVTSVPSGVDVPAPSASGVSNPALNILEPLKVGLAGVRNVGIATDPNTGIQGTCNVDSCDPQGNSASGESSLSVSRPSEVDFSDLASFLTESVNTQQVRARLEWDSLCLETFESDSYFELNRTP